MKSFSPIRGKYPRLRRKPVIKPPMNRSRITRMAGARSRVMVRRCAAFSESPVVPLIRGALTANVNPYACHMNQIAGAHVNDQVEGVITRTAV